MGLNFKTIFTGLKIKAKAILTSDTKGELEVSDSTGKLNYHDGLTRSPVVTESHTATLTNKTIDADNNTVSNLEVDNLKAGVLNTSTTLAGASDTQVPSALAVKTYIDDGLAHQNEASEITYDNSVSGLAATNAQDAIDEVEARVDTAESDITAVENALQAHITNPSDAHDASAISNDPSGNLAATTVQAALNELQTDLDTRATQSDLANHINQVTDAHDASAISVSPTVDLVSTTVQAALEELQAEVIAASGSASGVQANLDAHINDTVDAHDASAISVVPAGNLAATEVQAALEELQADIDTRALNSDLSNHISDTSTHGVTGDIVGTSDTQTLTNKTIDADLNTITNIENADIKAGANIARNKLASGTANSIIVNDGTGVLSEMANASNSANAITLTNLKHIELQSQDDATTTGSNATLATFTAGGVRITNGSLVSLANIPAGNNGQQFVLFNRTGVSVSIKDDSAAIGSAAARILTGTGADITLASNAALILSYDSVSQRWQVVGGSGGGSGTATSAIDNVFTINDATDPTKQINFDAGGTTATKTTIAASQTANRVLSLPDVTDTLVSRTSTDTLTNKTIVAANNTITTAASGNLTSTELNAALSELQQHIDSIDPNANELLTQNFEIATLADFTQTGLELVSSPFIHGTKTARLIHQAASTRSFKQTKSVDPKFRGKNLTLRLDGRSSAASANVTVLITDETNATTLASSTFTTGQITAAVFNTTNASVTVTVTDNSVLNSISIGASITGSGIPTGTTVTAKGTSTITLSQNATATASGVSLKVSVLPNIQSYSFDVPSNCSSISYTISALQEAGSPETYVDDIVIELTEMAMTSTSVTVPTVDIVQSSSLDQTTSIGAANITGALTTNSNTGIFSYDPVTGIYTVSKNSKFNISATVRSSGAAASLPVIVINGVNTSASSTNPLANYWISVSWSGDLLVGQTFFVKNAGNPCDIQRVYVSARTNPSTETKTIPLSSSVIVTESDSSVSAVGFTPSFGSTSNKYITFGDLSSFIRVNKGDAIQIIRDSVNGDRIKALKDGLYFFNFVSNNNGSVAGEIGVTTDLTSTTTIPSVSSTKAIVAYTQTGDIHEISGTTYLTKDQEVRVYSNAASLAASNYNSISVSYQGSTKILNPSSDQKVEIPTHELRFEGASARGSVATAIVKFDTLAKIKGDGFEVVNTAADGTVVTIKKAGKLDVSTSFRLAAENNCYLTKNSTQLTGIPTMASHIMGFSSSEVNDLQYINMNWSGEVSVGDIIRVHATANPSNSSSSLNLVLQETSVAVALQNVAPRWDDSDSAVRVTVGNGFGSTNTQVRRFSNVLDNLGSAIEYIPSAILGDSFLIKENGLYNVAVIEGAGNTTGSYISITKNNASFSVNPALSIASGFTSQSNGLDYTNIGNEVYLSKGDVIRLTANTPANIQSISSVTQISIVKVGKTQGTVDVTPFVQIPQNEVEAIEALTTTSTFGSTNTGVPVLNITKNTNKGIIQVLSSAAEGTSFKVLKDCTIDISATALAGSGAIMVTRNSTILTTAFPTGFFLAGQHMFAGPVFGNLDTTISCSVGDIIRIQRQDNVSTSILSVILTATAISPSIATPTEQVSSDTIPFVFKATAITDSDPVGTFNTYTYAANTNTATISATAPTQSTSSMNINGIQVFARAYNVISTAAQPARVDIKIGKGLKSKQVDAYAALAKTTSFVFDKLVQNTTIEKGVDVYYNETTGILIIDAGLAQQNTNTTRTTDSQQLVQTSGYFVFNASKSPSLVSIPNLQQRVAYLSDVKPGGTAGGSAVVGIQTRTLNTLVDSTGIVTNLSANQFTLPAGTYQIEASAPAYKAARHRAQLYSVTNSTYVLIGTSEYAVAANDIQSRSFISGEVVISVPTTFRLDHYLATNFNAQSLGVETGIGYNEVYSQVKITKIK